MANNKLLRELACGYTTCGRNVPLLKFLFVKFFVRQLALPERSNFALEAGEKGGFSRFGLRLVEIKFGMSCFFCAP